jgi:hypothetical protein
VKTYRDDKFQFEIDVPDEWQLCKEGIPFLPTLLFLVAEGWNPNVDITFVGGRDEIVNFVIEDLNPEPTPEGCIEIFEHSVRQNTEGPVKFGIIEVEGRSHAWASYNFLGKMWSKKYMIVLHGRGYAITGSCVDIEQFRERGPIWDRAVRSLRILPKLPKETQPA